ncbi:hypothetical protein MnTg02_01936 [bacterium MnTg02]|nr:hypothetical protein MnTg02_01936 [bacterium MnTg02]
MDKVKRVVNSRHQRVQVCQIGCVLLVGILTIALPLAVSAEPTNKPLSAAQSITIEAKQFSLDSERPERTKFGKLIWRGGIILNAPSLHFGGFSGLEIDETGTHLFAISDEGVWLSADIAYDGRRLKGLRNARLGPLRGRDGAPLTDKQNADAEGLAIVDQDGTNGTLVVSFERRHRIVKYAFGPKGITDQIGSLPLPAGAKRLSRNKGLEGLAMIKTGRLKGALIAFAERPKRKSGDLMGWLIGGPAPGPFKLENLNGFDVTGVALLPDGDLLILERRFRGLGDLRMRIRKVAARDVRPGAHLSGEILLELSGDLNIDNMEGIAAHRSHLGETVITLISDDNFNFFQSTLLMQFVLPMQTN